MAVVQRKRAADRAPGNDHTARRGPSAVTGAPGVTAIGSCRLPGLVGNSKLYQAHDAYLRPFGLLCQSAPAQYTVVLESVTEKPGGAVPDQLGEWAAQWDRAIAVLGDRAGLAAASATLDAVVIEDGRAVEMTRQWMDEASGFDWLFGEVDPTEDVTAIPLRVRARIALTFAAPHAMRQRHRDAVEMATELGRRLPGLSAGLQIPDNGPTRPLSAEELTEAVRVAYDPSISRLLARTGAAQGSGIRWDQAAPIDSSEDWGWYRHDGSYSVTWAMSQFSGGPFFPDVMVRWLQPDSAIAEKRVTLLYRAPRAEVPGESVAPVSRRGMRRRERKTAVAPGPSNPWLSEPQLVRHGLLATATVASREALRSAFDVVGGLSAEQRVLLRRVYGSQAPAFVAALPLGIAVPDRLSPPRTIRSPNGRSRRRGSE